MHKSKWSKDAVVIPINKLADLFKGKPALRVVTETETGRPSWAIGISEEDYQEQLKLMVKQDLTHEAATQYKTVVYINPDPNDIIEIIEKTEAEYKGRKELQKQHSEL